MTEFSKKFYFHFFCYGAVVTLCIGHWSNIRYATVCIAQNVDNKTAESRSKCCWYTGWSKNGTNFMAL